MEVWGAHFFEKNVKFCVKGTIDALDDMGWKEVQALVMHSRRLVSIVSGHLSKMCRTEIRRQCISFKLHCYSS